MLTFGSAPERVAELDKALFATVDNLRTVGPTEREVAEVHEALRRRAEVAAEQNEQWLDRLRDYRELGWPLDARLARPEPALEELTADAIREAVQRYLDPASWLEVVFLPKGYKHAAGAGVGGR